MKTIISILGGYGGVYNLWKELNTTNNEVELVYLNYTFEKAPESLKNVGYLEIVKRIVKILKEKERDFTFTVIEKDSWTKEPFHAMDMAYYAIDKFNKNEADKLIYHFLKDEESEFQIQLMSGINYRLEELATRGQIVFPGILSNLSKLHVIREMPSYLKAYIVSCSNPSETGEKCGVCVRCKHESLDMEDLKKEVSSEDFLIKKMNLIGRGPEPYEGTKLFGNNGNFECMDHPVYGTFGGDRVPTNYGFDEVPEKHIFV